MCMTIIIAVVVLWTSLPTYGYSFAGGTGEPNDPYQIATAEQLCSIGSDPNLLDKHFVLLNDIDLDPNLPGGQVFTQAVIAPDGEAFSWSGVPFTGSLNGRGYDIRNLIIHGDGTGLLGLFGHIGEQGVVRDLGIANADVNTGLWDCGTLAGANEGRISQCHVQSRVAGVWFVGGLVGRNNEGEIIECSAEGEIAGTEFLGGLVGENWDGVILNSRASSRVVSRGIENSEIVGLVGENSGSIVNCYATGDVSGSILAQVGGLVGTNGGHVVNCHATGNVTPTQGWELGGLVGNNSGYIGHSYAIGDVSGETSMYGSRDGKPVASGTLGGLVGHNCGHIYACYAGGDISGGDGSSSLGGLVGRQWGDVLDSYCVGRISAGENSTAVGGLVGSGGDGTKDNFWDIEASGLAESSGGTGLTTAQMQDAATFLAAGWDWAGEQANGLVDPWYIPDSGGYPMLTFGSDDFQPLQLDGSGTTDDPYRIVTAEDLAAINHYDLTACYRLEADINLAGIVWRESPIGYFGGRFDGAGRVVLNLRVEGTTYVGGLFGALDRSASVVNLGIQDASITGKSALGMLACINRGHIAACRADGTVDGLYAIGGLVCANQGSISDSYTVGEVTAFAPTAVGGLTGRNRGSIRRCYAAARVTSRALLTQDTNGAGGLLGDNNISDLPYPLYPPGQVYDSYFLLESDGGGPDNGLGVPLTDAQMKQQANFPGWGFEDTWTICEGRDYPRLRWEGVACEP